MINAIPPQRMPQLPDPGTMLIFICTERWSWVAELVAIEVDQTENVVRYWVRNRATIRRWGTTKGIGELVAGPTLKTEIDILPGLNEHDETQINACQVISCFPCAKEPWMKQITQQR